LVVIIIPTKNTLAVKKLWPKTKKGQVEKDVKSKIGQPRAVQ